MTYYSETFEHAGLHVRIYAEEYIEEFFNPRTNQDGHIGVMFCDYDGYTLGDADAPDPRGQMVECDQCKGSGNHDTLFIVVSNKAYGQDIVKVDLPNLAAAERYIERHAPEDSHWYAEPQSCPKCEGEEEVEVSIVEYLQREHGARVILPLFVYEHSGITMRAGGRLDTGEDNLVSRGRFMGDGAGWDTSTVGVIFDTAETRKACGCEDIDDDNIERQLKEEVNYYAAYLENQVYGYEVVQCTIDDDGPVDPESPQAEVLESMGGVLVAHESDNEYLRSEGREAAERCAEEIAAESREAFEMACRDVVTD